MLRSSTHTHEHAPSYYAATANQQLGLPVLQGEEQAVGSLVGSLLCCWKRIRSAGAPVAVMAVS